MALKDYANRDNCIETDKRSIISLNENNRYFILHNDCKKEIQKVTVDKCLGIIGKQCDFLLIIEELGIEIYVELKGNKIGHALAQLEATLQNLAEGKDVKRYCYIVARKVNPSEFSGRQSKKKKRKQSPQPEVKRIQNKYNALVDWKSGKLEKRLSKLI